MDAAIALHDVALREAIESCGGYVFKTIGDAFCAAFGDPFCAVEAAVAGQAALASREWPTPSPIRARMGLHTGQAVARQGDYFGRTVNASARLSSAGHGGQVLLSGTIRDAIGAAMPGDTATVDLGVHRLKDLSEPQHIYQLAGAGLERAFAPLRTLERIPHNLPVRASSFVGRRHEVEEITEHLRRSQLVTILGSGGAGKSRLALQVAGELCDRYADGTWLVELAALPTESPVLRRVASTLRVEADPNRDLLDTICRHLHDKQALLLLDNCEHVLEGCTELAEALIRAGARLSMLLTSRKPLQIPGEQRYTLRTLPAPPAEHTSDVLQLYRNDSAQLFIDRATEVRPDFELHATDAPVLADVCRMLDGIPLAIELAAARVNALSVHQIRDRLDDRFRLLVGHDTKARVPHHVRLDAAIEWSWNLLNGAEREALARLTVFRGGCTLEAAECVCAQGAVAEADVLDLIGSLVDQSLVEADTASLAARYGLLETIRVFALERLAEMDGARCARKQHLAWARRYASEAEAGLDGPEQQLWLDQLTMEHENLSAAMDWCLAECDESESSALDIAGSLVPFWRIRGHLTFGRERLSAVLAHPAARRDPRAAAKALDAAGALATLQGDCSAADEFLQQSLSLQRAEGDEVAVAQLLRRLGTVQMELGDYSEAEHYYEEALQLCRSLADDWGEAATTNNLGLLARKRGDGTFAHAHLEDALQRFRDLDDSWAALSVLTNLADLAYDLEDDVAAERRYGECLQAARELDDPFTIAYSLCGLAGAARTLGRPSEAPARLLEALDLVLALEDQRSMAECLEECAALGADTGNACDAVKLYGAAAGIRESIGAPPVPRADEIQRARQHDLQQTLGDSDYASAWEAGELLSFESAHKAAVSALKEWALA